MLGLEQWNSTLSSITGTLVRGTERVTSSALFNALEVGPDPSTRQKVGKRSASLPVHCLTRLEVGPDPSTRQKVGKRLVSRRLGWTGPRAMRIPGTTGAVQGYWRRPGQFPRSHTAGMPVAGESYDDVSLSDDLPAALEQVTRLGLKKLERILRVPLDPTDGNLVRSQVTAAIGAINAQLRADEHQLRRKTQGDAFQRLLKIIEEEQKKLSKKSEAILLAPEQQHTEHAELERSDAEASMMASGGDGSEEGH